MRGAAVVGAVALLLLLGFCYRRAMYETPDGIYTGYVDNYADLTLHIGIITGFVHGQNYPPEHPEFAGTRLAYPFVVDFVAAMFVGAGAGLQAAMFVQNMILTVALIVILYTWGRRLTGDRIAGALTAALVMLSGGFGFLMLFGELRGAEGGLWTYLTHLPHDYTAHEQRFRWANALAYWFVPMRSMLLGVPLFLVVTGLWWRALGYEPAERVLNNGERRVVPAKKNKPAKTATSVAALEPAPYGAEHTMAAAGVITGCMLLVHAHTCVTLGLMGLLLMLITRRWRMWIVYGAVAGVLVLPQGLWAIWGASVKAGTFSGFYPGWSGHDEALALAQSWVPQGRGLGFGLAFAAGVARYWLFNTGLLVPLLVAAFLWRGKRPLVPPPLRIFYLPFILCFVVPNIWKLAPWEWDNIKVLIYWFIPSVPIVALLLARLWRGSVSEKVAAALCVLGLTLSGALDLWRVLTGALEWRVFDGNDLAMGELIRTATPPRAVILNAPLHNHAFLLSGRRSFFGYPGTLWTHGISADIYGPREAMMKRIYAGESDAPALLESAGIDYVVVGPMERQNVKPLDEAFFARFPVAGRAGDGILYKVR
jgi:hypothetical protein